MEEARYTSPRSTEYLVQVLVKRQRATARHWFDRVNPLDSFAVDEQASLCFDDLALRHGLRPRTGTRYTADAFDHAGRATGWQAAARPGVRGRSCLALGPLPPTRQGYLIVRVFTHRVDRTMAPVHVHLARGPDSAPRVIGLQRH